MGIDLIVHEIQILTEDELLKNRNYDLMWILK